MITLYDFYAEWCQPCKQVTPIIEQLEKDNPHVTFQKIDIDKDFTTTENFGVMSIPTIIIQKDGKESLRVAGAISRTFLQKYLQE